MLKLVHSPRALLGFQRKTHAHTHQRPPHNPRKTREDHHHKNPPRSSGRPKLKPDKLKNTHRKRGKTSQGEHSNEGRRGRVHPRGIKPTLREARARVAGRGRVKERRKRATHPPAPVVLCRLATARRPLSTAKEFRALATLGPGRPYTCERAGLGFIGHFCPVCFQWNHWNEEKKKNRRRTLFKINNHNLK